MDKIIEESKEKEKLFFSLAEEQKCARVRYKLEQINNQEETSEPGDYALDKEEMELLNRFATGKEDGVYELNTYYEDYAVKVKVINLGKRKVAMSSIDDIYRFYVDNKFEHSVYKRIDEIKGNSVKVESMIKVFIKPYKKYYECGNVENAFDISKVKTEIPEKYKTLYEKLQKEMALDSLRRTAIEVQQQRSNMQNALESSIKDLEKIEEGIQKGEISPDDIEVATAQVRMENIKNAMYEMQRNVREGNKDITDEKTINE